MKEVIIGEWYCAVTSTGLRSAAIHHRAVTTGATFEPGEGLFLGYRCPTIPVAVLRWLIDGIEPTAASREEKTGG